MGGDMGDGAASVFADTNIIGVIAKFLAPRDITVMAMVNKPCLDVTHDYPHRMHRALFSPLDAAIDAELAVTARAWSDAHSADDSTTPAEWAASRGYVDLVGFALDAYMGVDATKREIKGILSHAKHGRAPGGYEVVLRAAQVVVKRGLPFNHGDARPPDQDDRPQGGSMDLVEWSTVRSDAAPVVWAEALSMAGGDTKKVEAATLARAFGVGPVCLALWWYSDVLGWKDSFDKFKSGVDSDELPWMDLRRIGTAAAFAGCVDAMTSVPRVNTLDGKSAMVAAARGGSMECYVAAENITLALNGDVPLAGFTYHQCVAAAASGGHVDLMQRAWSMVLPGEQPSMWRSMQDVTIARSDAVLEWFTRSPGRDTDGTALSPPAQVGWVPFPPETCEWASLSRLEGWLFRVAFDESFVEKATFAALRGNRIDVLVWMLGADDQPGLFSLENCIFLASIRRRVMQAVWHPATTVQLVKHLFAIRFFFPVGVGLSWWEIKMDHVLSSRMKKLAVGGAAACGRTDLVQVLLDMWGHDAANLADTDRTVTDIIAEKAPPLALHMVCAQTNLAVNLMHIMHRALIYCRISVLDWAKYTGKTFYPLHATFETDDDVPRRVRNWFARHEPELVNVGKLSAGRTETLSPPV